MSKLSAEHLSLSYDTVKVIDNIHLKVPEGEITVLIGSNGSGKSTLLRSLARLMRPQKGFVYLDGKDIHKQPTREVAKRLAILPQGPQSPEGLTVEELIYYGRHPHKRIFSKTTKNDHEMVSWALEATRMTEYAERSIEALSGGQRQRAWIAMALAQGTELLLLDEPTTYLDLAHQIEVLELLHQLNRAFSRTIVMVLHDLNQAARYADYLVCIAQGGIYQEGIPQEVFTEQMIRDVFQLDCYIMKDPIAGTPMCIPIGISASSRKNRIRLYEKWK